MRAMSDRERTTIATLEAENAAMKELARKLADAIGLLGDLDLIQDWQIAEKVSKDTGRTAEHNLLVREIRQALQESAALETCIEALKQELADCQEGCFRREVELDRLNARLKMLEEAAGPVLEFATFHALWADMPMIHALVAALKQAEETLDAK